MDPAQVTGKLVRTSSHEVARSHTDVMEMYCSPSEMEKYDKLIGNPASGVDEK